jgi:hypothetical protein
VNEYPIIDYQLFVELEGKTDFLVLVRSPESRLSEDQIKAICEQAWSLPTRHEKQRIGVVIVDKAGIWWRDSGSYE